MNLYEVCIQVLEDANKTNVKIDDDISREYLANEVYELFYEHQVFEEVNSRGTMEDLKDYWDFDGEL
tara:strand:- start:1056 stop:1256 length:201 start_codon:yes stop_codon:yes gene_type:complete